MIFQFTQKEIKSKQKKKNIIKKLIKSIAVHKYQKI